MTFREIEIFFSANLSEEGSRFSVWISVWCVVRVGKGTEIEVWSHRDLSYNFSKSSDYATESTDCRTTMLQVHSCLIFCSGLFFPGKKEIFMSIFRGHSPWRVMDTNKTARGLSFYDFWSLELTDPLWFPKCFLVMEQLQN